MIKRKTAVIITIFSFAFFLFFSTFFQPAYRFKQGEIKIFDDAGKILAKYSTVEDKIEYYTEGCEDYIDNVLLESVDIISNKYGISYNKEKLIKSKIEIYTNFSQENFNCLKSAFSHFSFEDGKSAEAAVVSLDGQLIASIGKNGKQNIVNDFHKPGSAIKPLSVYAPSIDNNLISWASSIEDSPFKKINIEGTYKNWPNNYNGVYSDQKVSLEESIAKSLNTTSVRVLDKLTPLVSCEFLELLGLDVSYEKNIASTAGNQEIYGNLALGELKKGVTAEELAAAYQIFINGGKYTKCYSVNKICENGKKIYVSEPDSKTVLKKSTSEIMNLLLQGVVKEGGTASEAYIDGVTLAGKTGTSQNYKDNWFVGLTPQYVCSVWCGYSEEQQRREKNEAINVVKTMIINSENNRQDFPENTDIVEKEYCVFTELLAVKDCKETKTGYFDKNNIPEKCGRH